MKGVEMEQVQEGSEVPAPAPPPAWETMPSSITFFLTQRERARVLKRLRVMSPDRSRALLIALGLRKGSAASKAAGSHENATKKGKAR